MYGDNFGNGMGGIPGMGMMSGMDGMGMSGMGMDGNMGMVTPEQQMLMQQQMQNNAQMNQMQQMQFEQMRMQQMQMQQMQEQAAQMHQAQYVQAVQNAQMMQMQGMKMRKIPKHQVYDEISMYVYQNTGIQPQHIQKLSETPDTLRHACAQTGITFLTKYCYTVVSQGMPVQVPFYFCNSCGKLFVFSDFET